MATLIATGITAIDATRTVRLTGLMITPSSAPEFETRQFSPVKFYMISWPLRARIYCHQTKH
jgi:hypothetical protein